MSKIKSAVTLLLVAFQLNAAQAVTFAQLAEKNARYVELKADLAIAKAEAEIADQKAKASGGGGAFVPPIQVSQAAASKPAPVPAVKPVEAAPERPEIYLNAIHGSGANLAADFQRQNQALSRGKGEYLFDGWQVKSIAYPEVVVVKPASSKKESDKCKRLFIGTPLTAAPNC
jgi:hypothetical protein